MYQAERFDDQSPYAHEATDYKSSKHGFDFGNSAVFSIRRILPDENARTHGEENLISH